MTTSVKMLEADKHRLDRLQGELMAKYGERIPQQLLLSWVMDLAEAERDRLGPDAFRPMTQRELERLHRLCVRTGKRSREEDIDRDIAKTFR
ncbi:MAG: hypothetical protein KGJ23_14505 [Euryarchaeota archaeon]|nr:hypothetical protein [Euryarchaeota archaeon]MDE1837811.1 hypothetical protein [Euryarchaeota archaeon]MDE1880085.1 hypothetical protein [Euryarchaeota archaeon]MDE2045077.1 hypothetical protein [Thermoplasmata archaeon]